MKTIQERTGALRQAMLGAGLGAYLVPTADPHGSEYVSLHDQARAYFTGFTGSAGTLLLTREEALLFTDSRYFLQAEKELAGSGIRLMKEGVPGYPTLGETIQMALGAEGQLGLDGRCTSLEQARALGGGRVVDIDLVSPLWEGRPELCHAPAFLLEERLAGRSGADKLRALREHMAQEGARAFLLTDLMDCAWLLNLRGGDIPHTPVLRMFILVEAAELYIFAQEQSLAPVADYCRGLGAELRPYEEIRPFLARYGRGDLILTSRGVSFSLGGALEAAGALPRESPWPALARSVKNPGELAAIREAHRKDGAVMVRFFRWLDEEGAQGGYDEGAVARKLNEMRRAAGCLDISFDTISGYGENAAIVHYHAPETGGKPLQPRGLLLVDSGGQWPGATTDITRTVALGPISPAERTHFTLVLRAMLALMEARFPWGTDGSHLDMLARQPLWEKGLDYGHGTGHGVGAMLSVHEDPVRIRFGLKNTPAFQPGMIVSDEPGLYFAGAYGIRTENLLECVECPGGMLGFRPLTLVPIDRAALDPAQMTPGEVQALDAYHARVYSELAPLLEGEDLLFLEQATRAL